MNPDRSNGPDGSSLKPVSSLRSHFESMNKGKDEPSPSPSPTTLRQRSPSPKPPPIPDNRPARPKSIVLQEDGRPKPPPPMARDLAPALRPLQQPPPPPVSPRPLKPPAVLVEPPQSPPKDRPLTMPPLETASLLNPDLSRNPSTPTSPTRSSTVVSQPTTPSLEPRRASPKPNTMRPPSPPPPRRSAELKREREARASATVPPPVNRAEKPNRSPFSSPPTAATVVQDDESPPILPTRPGRPISHQPSFAKTHTLPAVLDPLPLHHTVGANRRDQESNGLAKFPPPSPIPEGRPALPSRPTASADTPAKIPAASPMRLPPRPARAPVTVDTSVAGPQPKRISSTPTTQFAPPPTRIHARSMTVDRTSDRTPPEFREPPKRFAPTERPLITSDTPVASVPGAATMVTAYPDATKINRRPPFAKHVSEINTKNDSRIMDVCGEYVCASGQLTRVWNLRDGELLMSFAHGEGIKATSIAFKPGVNVSEEGLRLWIGNNMGEIMEADIATQSIVGNKTNLHGRYEVVKIFRHLNEMWTLDEGGTLHVWGPDNEGLPKLNNSPHQTYRLPKGHTFSMIVGQELWYITGKEIRIFAPTVDGRTQVQVLMRPVITEGAGEIMSGTILNSHPGKVYFGHTDGKVSIYSQKDFTCLGVISLSTYKINALAGVGGHIWAAYNTGRISVYDITSTPWIIKKDWQAHQENPTLRLIADTASFYRLGHQQVLSLGADNMVRVWDGLLQDDFLENGMKSMESKYCEFEDIKVLALTWNAGASTPNSLRYSQGDATFIQNLLQSSGCPDIFVFGFQELVDLEDKKATAKRLFRSSKKKDDDQEQMAHQYRDWRDFLVRSLDDYMPRDQLYHLLHTGTLVGLFTCIFVKSTLRDRIRNVHGTEVKCGMGGLYGNKGATVIRFFVDDSSLCFVNCHLAAGQSHANARHNDLALIMDNSSLPIERDASKCIDSFVGGGDGSMIMDHELCLLNGDLNYRIDTMSRDTVVYAVKANNLSKLLERDQLLVARRRNPVFKLRAFDELPIHFAPTYKYDVGTDNYDTSEKRRSPAWCDRLLHRGAGRIQQLDYQRHEVRVSDHRPVTGRFKFTVKSISPKKRTLAWADCQQRFEELSVKEAKETQ
ncbi:DNase I-like protein [Xylariaceae sp. FL0255]|nr:DNase I-like protein [Xylariaceae sp. FL0255]